MRDLETGVHQRLHADYVVAADGHRAGLRERLGVGADGPGVLLEVANFVFDADLGAALQGRRFLLAYLDRPTKGSTLIPLREFGRWALAVPYRPELGESVADFTREHCVELARQAIGLPDVDIRLVPSMPGSDRIVTTTTIGGWVARRYRTGRVFFMRRRGARRAAVGLLRREHRHRRRAQPGVEARRRARRRRR